MRSVYTVLSFLFFLNSILPDAKATHLMGASITYECLGGCTYRVYWRAYRDCSGIVPIDPDFDWVPIAGLGCAPPVPVTNWSAVAVQEVTPLCPGITTQCTNPNAAINGVQEYYQFRDYNICSAGCIYRLVWNECCRNNGITSGSAGDQMTTWQTTVNTSIACNSSPQFSNPPIPYICAGIPFTFNQGATDVDGDSLAYSLGPCYDTDSLTQVGYFGGLGYSPIAPLGPSWNVILDPMTGDLQFLPVPGNIEVGVICVYVNEYRNGVLIGTVVRDMQVTVINCGANTPPTTAGVTNVSGGIGSGFSVSTCLGSSLCFDLPVVDPDVAQVVTYYWNQNIPGATFTQTGGGPSDTLVGTNPSATFCWIPPAVGTYTFLISMYDDHCPLIGSNQFTIVITVNPPASVTATDTANCANVIFNATSSGGTAPFVFTWSGAGGFSGTGSNVTWTYAAAGNYPYTVLLTDAAGCNATFNAVAEFPGMLTLSLQPTDAQCAGSADGFINSTLSGGTAPYTWNWSTVPVQSSPNATNLSAGNYAVTVTDANNCAASALATVNEPLPLAIAMTSAPTSCNGAADGTATATVSGGTAPYSFLWNTIPQQTSSTATSLTSGTWTVTVTDANGCNSIANITVGEPAPVSLQLTASSVSCNGLSDGTVNVNAVGGSGPYSYNWSNAGSTPSQTGLVAGNYFVTVTDQAGCAATGSVNVLEPLPLIATVTGTNPVCNSTPTGTATVNVTGGTPGYTYIWSTIPVQTTSIASGLASGNYQVTITDNNGCQTNASVTLIDPPAVVASIIGPEFTCEGSPATLTSVVSGGSAPLQFSWSSNPAGFTSNQAVVTVYPSQPTTYSLTVTDSKGCVATADYLLPTLSPPRADFFFSSPQGCDTLTVFFTDQSTDASQWNWNFGDGSQSNLTNPSHTFSNGTWDVTLIVTAANGCTDTLMMPGLIQVIPSPVASFYSDPAAGVPVPEGQATFDFTNTSQGDVLWQWEFGDGATGTDEHETHSYTQPGNYTVTLWVYNEYGCPDSATLKPLWVVPDGVIYIPNAFTPNNDGLNDFFELKGEGIETYDLLLFNRWGEIVFRSAYIGQSWDGTFKGEASQEGVYVWKLVVSFNSGVDNTMGGTVTLIR